MKHIYRYPLADASRLRFDMPEGATILTIQLQHGTPQMWALVDDAQPVVTREFRVVGTGWDIEDDSAEYVGTYQESGGIFVWHLFELVRTPTPVAR